MSSDLTLPAIPGLLRRGSPCFIGTGPNRNAATISQIIDAHGAEVTTVHREPHKRVSFCYTFQSLHLDLTDATGRDHAARWLATLPQYARITGPNNDAPRWCRPYTGEQIWHLRSYGCAPFRAEYDTPDPSIVVPSLTDLDPDDDRRLPDGSRWVDAEAMRRVVLHVAGVSP